MPIIFPKCVNSHATIFAPGTMTDPSQPAFTITKSGNKLAPRVFWNVIAPVSFVIFKAQRGDIVSIGDKMFILAAFPESSAGAPMSQPDPGALSASCVPVATLAIENGAGGQVSQSYNVLASPYTSQVESSYRVRFQDQAELYTSTGAYNKPWVFAFNINAGMKSASVLVRSLMIPAACNYNATTFVNGGLSYLPTATIPAGVQIKTIPPVVVSYTTSVPAGSYTAGAYIDIVVTMTQAVVFSQLPDQFSQAAIDAASLGQIQPLCPYVQLNSNAYVALQGYALPNDPTKLLFMYQVSAGESTPDGVGLDLAEFTGLLLNGGSIKSATTGLAADFSSMRSAYGSVGEHDTLERVQLDCCVNTALVKF